MSGDERIFKKFLVPCGLTDDEEIVLFAKAKKIEDHRCPCCRCILEIDKSEGEFVHKASFGCSRNSVLHRTAIKYLEQIICDWKQKKKDPVFIQLICSKCGEEGEVGSFPKYFGGAYADFPITNTKGEWSVDLALLDEENSNFMQAAFYRSYGMHKPKEKAAEITQAQKRVDTFMVLEVRQAIPMMEELKKGIKLPWMEVMAEDIIEDPYLLKVIDSSKEWHECPAVQTSVSSVCEQEDDDPLEYFLAPSGGI